jgi:hypothetical protein
MDTQIKVDKALTQGSNELMQSVFDNKNNRRGLQVYTTSQIMAAQAKNKEGNWDVASLEQSYFFISPEDRIRISQLCTPVFGVVTSRMNRIAGTKFVITNDKREEDRLANEMKMQYSTYKDFKSVADMKYLVAASKIANELKNRLIDLLPDLSNFDKALLRWKRRIQLLKVQECDKIWDWLQQPNSNDRWEDFIRKYVYDMMIHGSGAIYKEIINGKLENIHLLVGGTVIPVKDKYVSSRSAHIQLINGEQPQIFYPDEICYATYVPTSARAYGLIPIEALMNKLAESLNFDKLSANQADGTRMPEKMIIIADSNPFGNIDSDLQESIPIAVNEQKRLEQKLNTPVKSGVMTFSGNNATIVDLSRENLMEYYNSRQKDIREDVALCFNMSSMEINLTGSDDVSGRATSESQAEIEKQKGIIPILKTIETKFTHDILPFRFGSGYILQADYQQSEKEEIELITAKVNSGVYSVNEIRINDMNEDPFEDVEFNKPKGNPSTGQQIDSMLNPKE